MYCCRPLQFDVSQSGELKRFVLSWSEKVFAPANELDFSRRAGDAVKRSRHRG